MVRGTTTFPKPTQLAYIWGVLRDVSQNRSITGRNLFWILKMHRPSMNLLSTPRLAHLHLHRLLRVPLQAKACRRYNPYWGGAGGEIC